MARPPAPLGDLLRRWLDRQNIEHELTQASIQLQWPEIVGQKLAARTEPRYLHDGVLTVAVASSAWLNELNFMRADLVKRINSVLGRHAVGAILLRSGRVEPRSPPPPAAPDPEPLVEVPHEMVTSVKEQAEEDVDDDELKKAIVRARLAELRRGKTK